MGINSHGCPTLTAAAVGGVACWAEGQRWAAGLQIYAGSCTTCHGANGEGSALAVPLNTPEVRAQEAAALTRTITEGVPGTMMAPWGKTLGQQEIDALGHSFCTGTSSRRPGSP